MAHFGPLEDKLVVLIGGGGFFGGAIAQELLRRGARVRIAERQPESAIRLRPLANLGQLQFLRCNVRNSRSVEAAVQGADAVVYLVGTFGSGAQALQADGAGIAARAAATTGAQSFVYISAIGADATSDSEYARTKGEGEAKVRAAFPGATILRPSVLFGEDDKFLNLFAGMIEDMPIVPMFAEGARLQPLWVDDAAAAVVESLYDPKAHGGKTYEIAGPEVVTIRELNQRIAEAQGRKRRFVAVPDGLAGLIAALPGTPITSDQLSLLKRGNVASGQLPGIGELGVTPKPLELFLERWMMRYRKYGRFGIKDELA